jgi:hypothetical protein
MGRRGIMSAPLGIHEDEDWEEDDFEEEDWEEGD